RTPAWPRRRSDGTPSGEPSRPEVMTGCHDLLGGSVQRVVDLDAVAQLAHQVLEEALLQPLLDLTDALAGHAEPLGDLDQRGRLVVEQAVTEDLEVAVAERGPEGVQLVLQDGAELAGL